MMEKPTTDRSRVIVAMSGGVDSSVVAALLVKQGYAVTGMMMKLWEGDTHREIAEKRFNNSYLRVAAVADQIGIRVEVIDLTLQFKERVVKYFLETHMKGKTPNPCFICNQRIKWGLLLEHVLARGAEGLATGHYARLIKERNGLVGLFKGIDQAKDQSYVLAGLTQRQLAQALLPLGTLRKTETMKIARSYNFPYSGNEESQDLCFQGGLSNEEFLANYLEVAQETGEIRDLRGNLIGHHAGLFNYTIGQRKGIGSGNKVPYYVLNKEVQTNTLVVGTVNELGTKRIFLSGVNWISGIEPEFPKKCSIKIRYKANPLTGLLDRSPNGDYDITFDTCVRDATPGQFAVFYDTDQVIGSGEINRTEGVKK